MERMAASVVAEAPAIAAVAPRPIAYRPGGEAARARHWVMALPHWSLFRLSDIPASRAVAAKTLSQLARSDPSIERVAKGFYLRGDPERAKPGRPQLYSRSKAAMARDFALAERPVSVICPSILTSLERWSSSVIGLEGHHAVRENLS